MNICGRCGEEVYFAEQKVAIGKVWHSFCFSCRKCGKLLDSCSVCPYNSELYCPACYRGISSTPNLPSCFRSKPLRCNPCIPFKPHQVTRNHHNPILSPSGERPYYCSNHLKHDKHIRSSDNCAYCNCYQCYCDSCVKGAQRRELNTEHAECICCTSNKGHFEVPKRCLCDNCSEYAEPVLPHRRRLYCFSRHNKPRAADCRTPQKSQEARTYAKSFNCHCCHCEGCKCCY